MASAFVSFDQIMPLDTSLPPTSFQVQFGVTYFGNDVTEGRDDTTFIIQIDLGDTAAMVNDKVYNGCRDQAMNRGYDVGFREAVLPNFTRG